MTDPRTRIDGWLYLPPGTCYEPEVTPDMAGALREVLAYADRLSEPQRTALEHAIATGAGLLPASQSAAPPEPPLWTVTGSSDGAFIGFRYRWHDSVWQVQGLDDTWRPSSYMGPDDMRASGFILAEMAEQPGGDR